MNRQKYGYQPISVKNKLVGGNCGGTDKGVKENR